MFRKYCSRFTLSGHIAKLRKRREHWKLVGSQAVQDIVRRLDNSYQRLFKWVKTRKGPKYGKPSFKKRQNYKSFTLTQAGWRLGEDNWITIQGRKYRFVKSREVEGAIKTVTIKRDSLGRLWVCFSTLVEDFSPRMTRTGKAGGFDFGLKTFLTCSDGSQIESPEFFKRNLDRIAECNRVLSRKKKGSNNRKKARRALAKTYQKVTNQRTDWMFKLANDLCDKFDHLFFEDLNIDGMKRLWGRKVSDLSFGMFIKTLTHVAIKKGKFVGFIDRFYPSSKTCSGCGNVNRGLTLSDREWACGGCGEIHDRDLNAAINILRVGASTHGLGNVIPAQQVVSA